MDSLNPSTTKVLLVAGSILASVVAMVFLFRKNSQAEHATQESQPSRDRNITESRVTFSSEQSEGMGVEKPLYRESVHDEWQYQVVPNSLTPPAKLSNLHYRILMNLNKGLTYEGSVTMLFTLNGSRDNPLDICFNGDEITHLSVNGQLVPEDQVEYSVQRIRIHPKYLQPSNRVEVIFSNKYSFFDDGMCTYFKINEDNKYSLKEQCIYSRNNRLNAPRIIPCFNQRTECKVELQILHPENFQAVSNSEKQLIRLVGGNDFAEYRFFVEDTNLNSSGLNSSFTSRMSTRSVKSKIKYCTKFKDIKLQSIQELFIACLPISEVRCKHALSTLVRFYCRRDTMVQATEFIPQLLNQLEQLEKTIGSKFKFYTRKVDIIFINSKIMSGYYTRGVIILNEKLLSKPLRPCTVYLTLRALIGMDIYREKLIEIEKLNSVTCECYPQIRNFLAIKQYEFRKIREKTPKPDYSDYFMEIFHVQVRYLCPDAKPDPSTAQWIKQLDTATNQEYWQHFVTNFEFVDSSTASLLVKLSIRKKGVPENTTLVTRVKGQLRDSRYLVHFLADEEIEPNLQKLARNCEKGLRRRLPRIQIQQQSQHLLSEGLMRYIRIPENFQECEELYAQFSKFDDRRNFHHCSIINEEIARIRDFRTVDVFYVDCKWSLSATRTLYKLDIRNKSDPVLREFITLYNEVAL